MFLILAGGELVVSGLGEVEGIILQVNVSDTEKIRSIPYKFCLWTQ